MIANLKTTAGCLGIGLLLSACASDPTRDAGRGTAGQLDLTGGYAAIVRIADATAAAGDCVSAIGLYRRASETWPLDGDVRIKLGHCFANLKAFNDAIASYQTGLKLTPGNIDARRGLGNVYIALDQPDLALPQFEAAQKIDPNDARIYNSLGVVLDMQGDHRSAQNKYRAGLAIEPSNISLLNNLGLSLALSGQFDEAITLLKPVAIHPAATARTRQNLALIYGLAGDSEQAARIARLDLDEASVRKNIAYYGTLRQLKDKARGVAIGTTTTPAQGGPAQPTDQPTK